MGSGGAAQRIEKQNCLTLQDPTHRSVALQHQCAPGTLKSSVQLALAQRLVLQAPYQSHVPLAQ